MCLDKWYFLVIWSFSPDPHRHPTSVRTWPSPSPPPCAKLLGKECFNIYFTLLSQLPPILDPHNVQDQGPSPGCRQNLVSILHTNISRCTLFQYPSPFHGSLRPDPHISMAGRDDVSMRTIRIRKWTPRRVAYVIFHANWILLGNSLSTLLGWNLNSSKGLIHRLGIFLVLALRPALGLIWAAFMSFDSM